ncbi:hypothetical protein T484DRAFT_1926249 [Baffinella frigidus]|nr:hypothetical protein T484DRAFT_1926249 [Cryptophyta sp. CCMP2293]
MGEERNRGGAAKMHRCSTLPDETREALSPSPAPRRTQSSGFTPHLRRSSALVTASARGPAWSSPGEDLREFAKSLDRDRPEAHEGLRSIPRRLLKMTEKSPGRITRPASTGDAPARRAHAPGDGTLPGLLRRAVSLKVFRFWGTDDARPWEHHAVGAGRRSLYRNLWRRWFSKAD